MDIADKFQEIAVGINEERFIPALKQMTHLLPPTVHIAGITKTYILDNAGQRHLTDLYCQMHMVRHQTVGMEAMLVSFYAFLEEKKEPASILLIKEYIMPCVAAKDDMVTSARIMETGFSSHAPRTTAMTPICQA